ncbi:unnamed protein product [Caenorhabditis brenneri]
MSETVTMAIENLPPDVSSQIITACQLIYGIPSFVLMVYFLIVLGYKNNYTNSFYRLVQIGLLVNISCSLNSWFATRLEKHPSCVFILKFIESIVPGALTIVKYLTYFYMHMQFLSITVMSIHRMFTVIFPSKFELICSKWYSAIGISFFVYSHLPKLLWTGFTFRVDIQDGQLMTLALPYILLVFDSNIRQDILRKRQNQVISVVATSGLS